MKKRYKLRESHPSQKFLLGGGALECWSTAILPLNSRAIRFMETSIRFRARIGTMNRKNTFWSGPAECRGIPHAKTLRVYRGHWNPPGLGLPALHSITADGRPSSGALAARTGGTTGESCPSASARSGKKAAEDWQSTAATAFWFRLLQRPTKPKRCRASLATAVHI